MTSFTVLTIIALGTAFVALLSPHINLRTTLIAVISVTALAACVVIPINIHTERNLAQAAELIKLPNSEVKISPLGELKVSSEETTSFSGETIPFKQEYTVLNPLRLKDYGFEVSVAQAATPNRFTTILNSLPILSTANYVLALAIICGTLWLCFALWRFGKNQSEYVPIGLFVFLGLIFTLVVSGIPNTTSFLALADRDSVTFERINNDLQASVKQDITISYQGREIISYNQVKRAAVPVNIAQKAVRSNPNGSLALALR